jgi:diguanylate cyclase (GGDEF)-like protein
MLHHSIGLAAAIFALAGLDWLIDPERALQVFPLRILCVIALLFPTLILALNRSLTFSYLASLAGLMTNAILFAIILSFIKGGMVAGAAGYAVLYLGSLLLGIGYPFSCNAWTCALLLFSVHVFAWASLPDFNHARHALQFWPVAAMTVWLHRMQRKTMVNNHYLRWEVDTLVLNDTLTGLMNRRSLEQAFQYVRSQAMRLDSALHLLLVDIDYFQQVVENHGYAFGDQMLLRLASVLRESFRGGDLVARLEGDRFACLLQNVDKEIAVIIAERLREKVRGIVLPGAATPTGVLPFTISVGVATAVPKDDLKILLNRAEVALYHAKIEGRNRTVCF